MLLFIPQTFFIHQFELANGTTNNKQQKKVCNK